MIAWKHKFIINVIFRPQAQANKHMQGTPKAALFVDSWLAWVSWLLLRESARALDVERYIAKKFSSTFLQIKVEPFGV
jgi:hypothetical protein